MSTYLYLYVCKYTYILSFFFGGGGWYLFEAEGLPTHPTYPEGLYKHLLSFKVVAQNAVCLFDIYTQLCQICQDVFMPKC